MRARSWDLGQEGSTTSTLFPGSKTGGQGEALNPVFGAGLVLREIQSNFISDTNGLQTRSEVRVLFAAPLFLSNINNLSVKNLAAGVLLA